MCGCQYQISTERKVKWVAMQWIGAWQVTGGSESSTEFSHRGPR